MNQPELFYEGYFEALRNDVAAVGGSKKVGKLFWPEKDAVAAGNKLNDCTNSDRRERLSDEQERLIMRLAREARGFSAAMIFICDDTGFERPRALAPQDESERLQRKIIDATQVLQSSIDRLERLTKPALQAVKS
jgi:hypothetical protein